MQHLIQPDLIQSDLIQIRRALRNARLALSAREQREHGLQLTTHALRIRWLWRARSIAVYMAVNGEIDTTTLSVTLRQRHKKLYLPVLRSYPKHKLWFARYFSNELRLNRFAILEPKLRQSDKKPPRMLDLIFVPLVAFDTNCNRLGTGGGFYDKTMAHRNRKRNWQRPRLIGVAHECQKAEHIPTRPWDISMDAIVTEKQLYIPHISCAK